MQDVSQELVKTGTTTIGIKCKDGIVLAADKRATAGYMIVDKRAEKIHVVDDTIALTIAGMVSDAQLLVKLVRAEIKLKRVRTQVEVSVREVANLLAGMSYYNIRKMSLVPGIVAFVLGGRDQEGYHVYTIGIDGSITEEKEYTSEGSGSVFAFGVLETLWKKDISIEDGMALAKKALQAALQRDVASGSGIDILTINKDGIIRFPSKEIEVKIE